MISTDALRPSPGTAPGSGSAARAAKNTPWPTTTDTRTAAAGGAERIVVPSATPGVPALDYRLETGLRAAIARSL